jgi:hypothetical protein
MKNILQNKPLQRRKRCFGKKIALLLPAFFLLTVFSGCDLLNNSMVEYFKDTTGIVEAREVAEKPPGYYRMADGTILIPPGSTIIDIPLLNPRNLNFRYALLGVPAGKTIVANQAGLDKLELAVTDAIEGDAYDLTLALQSPDGLRDFAPCNLRILCVSFETGLLSLAVKYASGTAVLDQPFNPTITDYTAVVPGAIDEVSLEGTTVHGDATLSINGGFPVVSLAQGNNGPYVFRVTAPNTVDTKDYQVTVFRGDASKAITAFSVTSPVTATGTINEGAKTITVNVPYGTAVNAMTTSVNHTGASVASGGTTLTTSPAAFSGQDFTAARTYTVTAADSTTQPYTVTVNVAANTAKAITAFSITSPVTATGTINEGAKTITVNVPYGTAVAAMTASVNHTGASVASGGTTLTTSPAAFSGQDFTAPRTYTVTAADGSTQDYTVTVNVAASTNANLSGLTVSPGALNTAFDAATLSYTVNVPSGTTAITLTGTKADPTATLKYQKGAGTLQDSGTFTSLVSGDVLKAKVTAQDGVTIRTYTVTVNVAASTNANLSGLTVSTGTLSTAFDAETLSYTVNVPYGTTAITLTGTKADPAAMLKYQKNTDTPQSTGAFTGLVSGNVLKAVVTAQDGVTTQTYTVTVNVAKITSVTAVTGALTSPSGFVKTGSDISGAIKDAITSVTGTDSLGGAITIAAADYSVDSITPDIAGSNTTAKLRVPGVKTSTGSDITENFTVYIKNNAKAITGFSVTSPASVTGTVDGATKRITIPATYPTAIDNMTFSITYTGASVTPPGGTAQTNNPANVSGQDISDEAKNYRVTAEDGTYQDYLVTVNLISSPSNLAGILDVLDNLPKKGTATITLPAATIPVTAEINIPDDTKVILLPPASGTATLIRDSSLGEYEDLSLVDGNLTLGSSDGTGGYIVIDGGNIPNSGRLFTMQPGSTLNMYANVTLQNNKTATLTTPGGVVYVDGTFNMYGGTIQNNSCTSAAPSTLSVGGVYVTSGSRFNMSGGIITGNTGFVGGVRLRGSGARFEITGGTISGNNFNEGGTITGVGKHAGTTYTNSGGGTVSDTVGDLP